MRTPARAARKCFVGLKGDCRFRAAGILAILVLILDQASKWQVAKSLALWSVTPVIPGFFNLSHIVNRGAAFGFLNRADSSWQVWFFVAASVVALAIILKILASTGPNDRVLRLSLGLILGGALGNLADRVRLGQVVDFLDFYLGSSHYPAFNVADIGITLGAVGLAVSLLRKKDHVSGPL